MYGKRKLNIYVQQKDPIPGTQDLLILCKSKCSYIKGSLKKSYNMSCHVNVNISHRSYHTMSYLSRWEVRVVVIWEVDSPVVHGVVEGVPGELTPRHPH